MSRVASPEAAPRSVRLTKSMVWALMILHIFSNIIGLLILRANEPAEYFQRHLPVEEFEQLTPELLDSMFSAAQASFTGFAVFNAVIFVVVGLGLRANKHWARFLGLVLAILFLISAAYSLLFATPYGQLSGLPFVQTMISWVIVFVTVWWIIQAMDKRTGVWFAMHRHSEVR